MQKLALVYQERSYEFGDLLKRQREITIERERLVSTLSSLYLERKKAKQNERENDHDKLKQEVVSMAFKMKTIKDNWTGNLKSDPELLWSIPEYYELSKLHERKKVAYVTLLKGNSTKRADVDEKINDVNKKLKALKEDLLSIQRRLDEIQVYFEVEDYTTFYNGSDVFMEVTRYTISIRKKMVTHKNGYIYFKKDDNNTWYKSKFDPLRDNVVAQMSVARLVDEKESKTIDGVLRDHLKHLNN